MPKMEQLTLFRERDELIDTQYGYITYIEWLQKEKDRITSDPTRTAEIISDGLEAALYANWPVFDKDDNII